jgi:hypothetical protein
MKRQFNRPTHARSFNRFTSNEVWKILKDVPGDTKYLRGHLARLRRKEGDPVRIDQEIRNIEDAIVRDGTNALMDYDSSISAREANRMMEQAIIDWRRFSLSQERQFANSKLDLIKKVEELGRRLGSAYIYDNQAVDEMSITDLRVLIKHLTVADNEVDAAISLIEKYQ